MASSRIQRGAPVPVQDKSTACPTHMPLIQCLSIFSPLPFPSEGRVSPRPKWHITIATYGANLVRNLLFAHPYNNGYIYTHTPHALFEDKQTCQGNKNLLPNMEGSWTIGFDQFGYLAQRAKELLGLLLPQGQRGRIMSPPFHRAVTCSAQLRVPKLIHVFTSLCNPSRSVGFGTSQSLGLWEVDGSPMPWPV